MNKKAVITSGIVATPHALKRLNARRITDYMVELILSYGRVFHANDAFVYFVGRKEVKKARQNGIDIRIVEGVNLIFQYDGEKLVLLTAFRNNSLKRYKH